MERGTSRSASGSLPVYWALRNQLPGRNPGRRDKLVSRVLNGDGFVDYFGVGNSQFGLNNGSSFASTSWSSLPPMQLGAKGTFTEDTYQKTYYVEDPFRAWKAYRSGTVVVEQTASLLQPRAESSVSLLTDLPGQTASPPIHLMPGQHERRSPAAAV